MDKYDIKEILGDGTYGSVYKAFDLSSGEVVAVKKLKQKAKTWKETIDAQEVQILKKLKDHPNIIKLKEVVRESSSDVFYIFEYADQNLYHLMDKHKKSCQSIDEDDIQNIIGQLAKGLFHMHSNHIFHRDLKPENILLQGKSVKLADFGLAKEYNDYTFNTDYVCTRWYRAPECILKSNSYTPSIDVWALGAIAAELYLLKPLFPGISQTDQLLKITSVIGTPSYEDWQEGFNLINDCRLRFPINYSDQLELLLSGASNEALDFIRLCLQWNPAKRATCQYLLNHDYLSSFNGSKISSNNKQTLSYMDDFSSNSTSASNSNINNSNSSNSLNNIKSINSNLYLQGLKSQNFGASNITNNSNNLKFNQKEADLMSGLAYKGILSRNKVITRDDYRPTQQFNLSNQPSIGNTIYFNPINTQLNKGGYFKLPNILESSSRVNYNNYNYEEKGNGYRNNGYIGNKFNSKLSAMAENNIYGQARGTSMDYNQRVNGKNNKSINEPKQNQYPLISIISNNGLNLNNRVFSRNEKMANRGYINQFN